MTDLHMSPKGYNVLKSNEGRSLRAYKDVVGVWTIGYGNTNSDAAVLGFEIKAGVRITDVQAESLLKIAMEQRYEPTVNKTLPDAEQHVRDASYDFVYNIGTAGFAGRGWVKSWLKDKDASGILAYDHAGGKVYPGLTRRRKRELAMIDHADYGPEGVTAPPTLNANGHVDGGSVPATVPAAPVPAPVTFPASTNMLRVGSTGQEVTDFQTALCANGYKTPVTGTYTVDTEDACRKFQAQHPQLDMDGIGGPATRAALQRGVDAKSKGKRTVTVGTATGGAVTADHTAHAVPLLPTWSVCLLAVAFVATAAFVAWQYRDELKAMFLKVKGGRS